MNKILFLFCFSFSFSSFSQDKKIDQLEVYYAQGHYSKVVRKSKALLANPEYDYSGMPIFYKSLATFRMANDLSWFKRHKSSVQEAINFYESFLSFSATPEYISAHYQEIVSLKDYLKVLESNLDKIGYKHEAEIIKQFINKRLSNVKGSYIPIKIKPNEVKGNTSISNNSVSTKSIRTDIVMQAEKHIGTPYVWAGNTPSGFDCSGYTAYILKQFDILLPRRASDQKLKAKKISIKNAQKGDLVFFGSGSSITHVGIVVSDKGEPLTMIHASTSKGIMITNIENSTYWMPKLKGVGSVID